VEEKNNTLEIKIIVRSITFFIKGLIRCTIMI